LKKYIYETYILKFSAWSGKAEQDYLNIINEYGARGWRFVGFPPGFTRPKGMKGIELLFEKEVED
jgi:hypothetical protein